MDWFRWHRGTVSDPKWRVVAAEAGVRVVDVVGVWAAMLEHASENEPRGSLAGWNDRVTAIALELPAESVLAIRQAMQGLTIDGDELPRWSKRQPKREDDSAPRVRAHRERQKDMKRTVTQSNSRVEKSRGEEKRVEEIRTEKKEERAGVLKLHASEPVEKLVDEIMIAANRGMIDNPLIGNACQPIPISHGSRQAVTEWLAEGIPAEVARLAVYQRAKEYRPDGRRRQLTTMAYFNGAVRDEADKYRARSGEAPSEALDRKAEVLTEFGKWKKANPDELAAIERATRTEMERYDWWEGTTGRRRLEIVESAVREEVEKRIATVSVA